MRLLLFIYIIVCRYTSTAGNDANKVKTVDLDVNTRDSTDKVKVTKSEVKDNVVTYKLKPQSGYKIGRFVDGDKIVLEPKDDKYKYAQVKYIKDTTEPIIVLLIRSSCLILTSGDNYFNDKKGWIKMTFQFYDYISYYIKNGYKINRETEFEGYNQYLKEKMKYTVSLDIRCSKGNDQTAQQNNQEIPLSAGITKTEGTNTRIYTVDDKHVITTVKVGSDTIWEQEGYVFGCYYVKAYLFNDVPTIVILDTRDSRGSKRLYYKKGEKDKYNLIEKDDFKRELNELAEKAKSSDLPSDDYCDDELPESGLVESEVEVEKVDTEKVDTSHKVDTEKVDTSHKVDTEKVDTSHKVDTEKVDTSHKVDTEKVDTSHKVDTEKVEVEKVDTEKVEDDVKESDVTVVTSGGRQDELPKWKETKDVEPKELSKETQSVVKESMEIMNDVRKRRAKRAKELKKLEESNKAVKEERDRVEAERKLKELHELLEVAKKSKKENKW